MCCVRSKVCHLITCEGNEIENTSQKKICSLDDHVQKEQNKKHNCSEPKKTLTRLQKLALKNVLGIRDNLNPETWSKIEESIGFFMKIGKFLKYRNISTYHMKDPNGWRDEEFMICTPNTPGAECHSACGFGSSEQGYKFCYLKGGSYDYCSCKIPTPMKY